MPKLAIIIHLQPLCRDVLS